MAILITQAYLEFMASLKRAEGETDEAFVQRVAAAAKSLKAAAAESGIYVNELSKPFHLDSVDVANMVGDPDITITAPGITLVEIADETRQANESIDAVVAKVRNNIKVGLMTAATVAGTLAGGGAPAAVLPVIAGALGKIQ